MALRPAQLCRRCNQSCYGSYCDAHMDTRREYDRERGKDPLRKLYKVKRWADTRMIVLARDPICRDGRLCGHRSLSTVVDHVIPARQYVAEQGGDTNWFYDENNLRGSCKPCHDSKTATEDSTFVGSRQ